MKWKICIVLRAYNVLLRLRLIFKELFYPCLLTNLDNGNEFCLYTA